MRGLLSVAAALTFAACSSDENGIGRADGGDSDMGPDGPPPAPRCEFDDLLETPFSDGPYGTMRHDIADDFSLELIDGTTFTLSEHWNGCDSYLFVPDTRVVSDLDPTSLWENADDIREITRNSPPNAHYFFVSRQFTDGLAEIATEAMALRIEDVLNGLDTKKEADYWRERLHVVATRAGALDNWVGEVLQGGIGFIGFAIDRQQTLRGIGSLSDVRRFNGLPPPSSRWNGNLSYVVYEVQGYNFDAARRVRLAAEDATVVSLWSGEVLSGAEDTTIELPGADEMAEFDTFEIDVTMRCPASDRLEPQNCGEWDYIAQFYVQDVDTEAWVELGRFITSYSREGRLIVDATPMLVHLLDGGERTFRWAVGGRPQPTATWLDLRFSNRGKGKKPFGAAFLWTGGSFNDDYNALHPDMDVPVPADAVQTELWAIITGHGGVEPYNCAEFCDHHHEFTVEGNVHTRTHPAVDNPTGCLEEIGNGVVPNQWGTWWFGRGGWCPGKQVEPYVVDVSGDVTPGSTATVRYRGLLRGSEPTGDNGRIEMVSYLVFYR